MTENHLKFDFNKNGFVRVGDLAFVAADNGINIFMKQEARVSSETVCFVPDNAAVFVVEKGEVDDEGMPWAKVLTQSGMGYVLQIWLRLE